MIVMSSKDKLHEKFSSQPDKYYKVELFAEEGFKRQKCNVCGKYFWSLSDAKRCPDPPCTTYGFIGNSPVKGWERDYVETWKVIEKFFVKNGHESVPSYPTVCRWFPGLYFTIASIVAFQRVAGATPVFEFPANPLVIPQVSLRFSDIPNVGVSGRHYTSFIMIGQHSLYDPAKKQGYWKDRCIELDWQLLTKVFRIPPEEISFVEDVWLGPAAFGYSLEYYVRGLELGNAVFTEFLGTPENYRQMDRKIIEEMRKEFLYWYPVDLRNSAKELLPHHLTFFIFQHVALFGEKLSPRAIAANGFANLEGKKMSKSTGNFITLQNALENYGADLTRACILTSSEGIDDADWRSENIPVFISRLSMIDEEIKNSKK